jgi:predicted PurR-regulated permease PerM
MPHRSHTEHDPDLVTSLPSVSDQDRGRLRMMIILVLAGFAAYAILRLLAPFLPAIVGSAVLAVLAHPLERRIRDRVHRRSLSAFLASLGIFVVVLIPLFALSLVLASSIDSGISAVANRFDEFSRQGGLLWEWVRSTAQIIGVDETELSNTLRDQLSGLGRSIAGSTVGILSGLGGWLVQGAVGLFTLFYLLRDGERIVREIRWLIPLDAELTEALIEKTHEVVSATVLGTLVVAAVQGTLGGLLFWAIGLPAPALWGSVMAFLSLLPAVGPPLVWVPAAIILGMTGQWLKAIIVTAFGALVIGTVDNVLRSLLVGQRAQLHPLVVFFSVLGGLAVFGTAGFLLGPVLFVTASSILEIARVSLDGEPAPEVGSAVFQSPAEERPEDPGTPEAGEGTPDRRQS